MAYVSDMEEGTSAPPPSGGEAPYSGSNLGTLQKVQDGAYVSDMEEPPKKKEERVPEWSEIPGMMKENAAESGLGFLRNVAHPFIHPLETLETIGGTALGLMGKAGLYGSNEYEKYPDAIGKMVMDRYGGLDNFKKTLATDPVGVLGDFSAVATGGGATLAGTSRAIGLTGKTGDIINKIGSTVDPLNAITKPIQGAAHLAGAVGKEIGGFRSGAGPEAFGEAAHAGFEGGDAAKAFQENLRGKVPIETPVRQAMNAIENMVKDKSAGYKTGMAEAGLDQPISTASFNRLSQGMIEAADIGQIKGYVKSPAAIEINSHLMDVMYDFLHNHPNFHTVEGLDALKQRIGIIRDALPAGSPEKLVANKYYGAALEAITDQAPKYAKVMEVYGEGKDALKQLQHSLSLPANERRLNVDTALRKLQSVMRNNVNTNYGYRTTLLQLLKENGAPNISSALAGQALNAGTPRGLSRISLELGAELGAAVVGLCVGHPELILPALGMAAGTAITSSPRVLGEAAYYAGRAASPAKYTKGIFNRPAGRAAQQLGRVEQNYPYSPVPEGQSRGGAIDRALRLTKKK